MINYLQNIGLLFCFISLLSCNSDDVAIESNTLIKRVILIESYDPNITSFVSDSIIEYYESKLIVKKEHHLRTSNTTPYIGIFYTFHYNHNELLSEIKSFKDHGLTQHYASTDYYYNPDQRLLKKRFDKFNASNLSSNLSNRTRYFEYDLNTIRSYWVDHLNGDTILDDETHIVYGSIDSIQKVQSNQMWLFDNDNDCYEINYVGDSNSPDYFDGTDITYGDIRQPLIDNIFGNTLNAYLEPNIITFQSLEINKKNTKEYFYRPGIRNAEIRRFNYTHDGSNRLSEIFTTGTFAANYSIKYYYE